jgi:hypothetical protein
VVTSSVRFFVAEVLVLMTLGGCRNPANAEKQNPLPISSVSDASVSQPAPRKTRRIAFSLIELIANPRQYQGTDVSVIGYLVMDKVHEDEDDATLYLERESARMNITTNGISVRFGACRDRIGISNEKMVAADPELLPSLPGYVVLKGTFEPAPEDAPFGRGRICAVTSVIGRDDPEQGVGAKSWWNRVARPPMAPGYAPTTSPSAPAAR